MKGMGEFGAFQTVENRSDLLSTVWKRGYSRIDKQGVVDNLPLLVRFAAVARIVVCSQGASGRESPDRSAAANPYVRRFPPQT